MPYLLPPIIFRPRDTLKSNPGSHHRAFLLNSLFEGISFPGRSIGNFLPLWRSNTNWLHHAKKRGATPNILISDAYMSENAVLKCRLRKTDPNLHAWNNDNLLLSCTNNACLLIRTLAISIMMPSPCSVSPPWLRTHLVWKFCIPSYYCTCTDPPQLSMSKTTWLNMNACKLQMNSKRDSSLIRKIVSAQELASFHSAIRWAPHTRPIVVMCIHPNNVTSLNKKNCRILGLWSWSLNSFLTPYTLQNKIAVWSLFLQKFQVLTAGSTRYY